MSVSILPQSGQAAIIGRIRLPLATSQTFTPNVLVALNSSGLLTPVTASNSLICAGRLDATSLGAFGITSPGSGTFTGDVTQGSFLMQNATSGEALTASSVGDFVYTVDGVTARLDNSGGAALCGQLLGFDNTTGLPIVQVVLAANQTYQGFASSVGILHSAVVAVTASASSVVLSGATVGSTVIVATDLTTPGDVRAAYESTISISGHIQQTAASGSDGITTADKVQILLQSAP